VIHAIKSGVAQLGGAGDAVQYVVSPVSIPVNASTLQIHIKKNAFLVHVTSTMPVAMDEAGIVEFLAPLFKMQSLGSRNNVLIADGDRMATGDALLAWQLFGGIALPVIGNVNSTLKVLDQMLQVPMNALSGEKRAVQFTTNLPYTDLEICDDWSMEMVLIYALVNGKLPHSDKEKVFDLSRVDRDTLLRDIKEMTQ
jgi:hypothetical protein